MSQRGIADTLKRLKDSGAAEVNLPSSRSSVKRARVAELEKSKTRYGPLIQSMELLDEEKKIVQVRFVHPVCLLAEITERREGYAKFFTSDSKHDAKPSSLNDQWRLAVYCDEVSPGNQLKGHNERKFMAIYWAFLEHGSDGLSKDSLWFPLAAIKSSTLSELGGITRVWPKLLETFFAEHSKLTGLYLEVMGARPIVFLLHTTHWWQTKLQSNSLWRARVQLVLCSVRDVPMSFLGPRNFSNTELASFPPRSSMTTSGGSTPTNLCGKLFCIFSGKAV